MEKEIIICDICEGAGEVSERTSAYDTEEVTCWSCKGSGRLIKTTTIEPFIK